MVLHQVVACKLTVEPLGSAWRDNCVDLLRYLRRNGRSNDAAISVMSTVTTAINHNLVHSPTINVTKQTRQLDSGFIKLSVNNEVTQLGQK